MFLSSFYFRLHFNKKLQRLEVRGFVDYKARSSSSLARSGFSSPSLLSDDVANFYQEFLPLNDMNSTDGKWNVKAACYIAANITDQFRRLLDRERTFLEDCKRWKISGK